MGHRQVRWSAQLIRDNGVNALKVQENREGFRLHHSIQWHVDDVQFFLVLMLSCFYAVVTFNFYGIALL